QARRLVAQGGARHPGQADRHLQGLDRAGQLPDRLSDEPRGAFDGNRQLLRRQPRTGARGHDRGPPARGLCAALFARPAQGATSNRGGFMSEDGGNARIIPFLVEEEEETIDGGEIENPARRLHIAEAMRMAEAIVFASAEPVTEKALIARLPEGIDVPLVMRELQSIYEKRGVNLVRVGEAWAFRTAGDLAFLMSRDAVQQRKLSRAALEALAIS